MPEQRDIFSEVHARTVGLVQGQLQEEIDEFKKGFKASLTDLSVLDSFDGLKETAGNLLNASGSIDRKKQILEQIELEMTKHDRQMRRLFKELGYPLPTRDNLFSSLEGPSESTAQTEESHPQEIIRSFGGEEYMIRIPDERSRMPIEELDLSPRSYNCLKRSNVSLVRQVLLMSEEDLFSVRHFNTHCLNEVAYRLKEHGFIEKVQN